MNNSTSGPIWKAISQIPDPEMPVITLAEMGILRQIRFDSGQPVITITPTFSGCPALETMQEDILACLAELGYAQGRVEIQLSPPWSTDWITPAGRKKLSEFGITPAPLHRGLIPLALLEPVPCPHCGSEDTQLQNSFGATPCRMIHTCRACRAPFESIKPL